MVDLCDGAHSLGELDFAGLCREHGLPEPTRQAVRTLPDGRIYLDVAWEDIGLVVEIDGGHHALALDTVDDALRRRYQAMKCASLLRETLCSMVSEIHSEIDFDYVAYTAENLAAFQAAAREFQQS